jgi:hypothetical protein
MKLSFENKKFVLSEIEYEMIQIIINGIDCERKRIIEKISELTKYLFKDYSDSQKEEFKIQIDYLKEKNDELKSSMDNLIFQMEEISLP